MRLKYGIINDREKLASMKREATLTRPLRKGQRCVLTLKAQNAARLRTTTRLTVHKPLCGAVALSVDIVSVRAGLSKP
jgi:hypothetical protein